MATEQKRSVPETGKNGELAVFYNLAYNRTGEFIRNIQQTDNAPQLSEIRDIFFPVNRDNGERKAEIREEDLDKSLGGLTDRTYSELKVFMWNEARGKDIRFVTREEIAQINHMLLLLLRLRDFHSHYWHEDTALIPTSIARAVIDIHYNLALRSYKPQINFAIDISPLDCWQKKDPQKLSHDGVNFVLGVFLTRGQMELFMKSRKYLNRGGYSKPPERGKYMEVDKKTRRPKTHLDGTPRRADDVIDLEKSRYVAGFYSARDAAESSAIWLGKYNLFNLDAKQYHLLQLDNYLETIPNYLFSKLPESKQDNQVQRMEKTPVALLATSIAFIPDKIEGLEWRIHSDKITQKKLEHKEAKKDDLLKIPDYSYTPEVRFTKDLGVDAITTKRLQQETGEVKDEDLTVMHEMYTTADDKIIARLDLGNKQYMNFVIGYENLKHWGALAAMNKNLQAGEALKAFAAGFTQWIDALRQEQIMDLNPTYLNHFNGGVKHKKNNTVAASLLPDILIQLNSKSLDRNEAFAKLKTDIKNKLKNIINPANGNHFSALAAKYAVIKTDYLNKNEQENLLREINGIKGKIKGKQAKGWEITKLKELEKKLDQAGITTTRHEKMQLMLHALNWLLGIKGRFRTAGAKNAFMKYCYLLDMPHLKNSTRTLIAEWLDVATTVSEDKKTHPNQPETPEQLKVKKILEEEAISFDDCFSRLTQLAMDKYKREHDEVDKMKEYENLLGLARRLGIANPSNTIKGDQRRESPHTTRRREIMAPFYRQQDETANYYVYLPHGFFMIAPETKAWHQFKNLPDTKQAFDDIKKKLQAIDSNPAYTEYFSDFQKTNRELNEAKTVPSAGKPQKVNSLQLLNQLDKSPAASLKARLEKIKLFYGEWYADTVFELLKRKIENTGARVPSRWGKKETGSVKKRKKLLWNHEIEGVNIGITLKQLKNHDFYWGRGKDGNLVNKVIKRLKAEKPDKKEYTFEEIKTAMQGHWKESITFISALLQYEMSHEQAYTGVNQPYKERLGYVPFDNFKTKLPANFDKYRNYALHGDILEPGLNYQDLVKELQRGRQKLNA